MTEARARRKPGSGPVFWISMLLFCALLGLLTYRFASGNDPSGVGAEPAGPVARTVIVRRVVTTVVPAAGAAAPDAAAPAPVGEAPAPEPEPVTTSAS